MNITVKGEAAEVLSQGIASKGGAFTNFAQAALTGGNTAGVERSCALGSRAQSLFSRYQTVVERDGKQITVLAKYFEELDEKLGNQIQERM